MKSKTREESTGMELLRRLADDVRGDVYLWPNLDFRNDAWWGTEQCGESLAHALRSIADKIDADFTPRRPRTGASLTRSA